MVGNFSHQYYMHEITCNIIYIFFSYYSLIRHITLLYFFNCGLNIYLNIYLNMLHVIWDELIGVLLHILRSQLKWCRDLTRMLPGQMDVFPACPAGRSL